MKQSTTSSSVRCSLLPPQLYFIRKATACLHSFIPICADSIAVGMVIVMKQLEIYFQDLNPETQEAVLDLFGISFPEDANWDSFPIFTLEVMEISTGSEV